MIDDKKTVVDKMLEQKPLYRGISSNIDELKMKAELKARIAPEQAEHYLGAVDSEKDF